MTSDEELLKIASESYSVSDLMGKLGLVPMGGNHRLYKERVSRLGIVFKKRPLTQFGPKRQLGYYLVLNCQHKIGSSDLRKRLIAEGFKENKCEKCGLGPVWNAEPLALQLDHVNGDNRDNHLDNLRILCPNCHTQTPTYGMIKPENQSIRTTIRKLKRVGGLCKCGTELLSRNISGKCRQCYKSTMLPPNIRRCECGGFVHKASKSGLCRKCFDIKSPRTRKVQNRPVVGVLLGEVNELGWSAVGRKYGVSDNAVRKWIRAGSSMVERSAHKIE